MCLLSTDVCGWIVHFSRAECAELTQENERNKLLMAELSESKVWVWVWVVRCCVFIPRCMGVGVVLPSP